MTSARAALGALLSTLVMTACAGTDNDFSKKVGTGPVDPPARNGTADGAHTLRIAVLHLGALYDDEPDPTAPDASTLPSDQFDPAVAAAASLIDAQQVDVALVSGVGSQRALDLIGTTATRGLKFSGFSHGNDGSGLGVGVLSRLPIGRVTPHAGDMLDGGTYSHDCLEAHLSLPHHEVVFFAAFFAAGDLADDQRLAEAKGARHLADVELAADPFAEVVLGGDFETTPGTDAYAALLGDPPLAPTGAQTTGFEDQLVNDEMAGFRDPASVLLGGDPDPALAALGAHPAVFATYTVP